MPPGITKRAFPRRVAIHPTSREEKKNWPKDKYISLAERLLLKDWDPVFILASYERPEWQAHINEKPSLFPFFPTLKESASFVAESGFFIGNDSGMGHLASNIGIPTLTLFARTSYSNLWRPGWGEQGRVIVPLSPLIGARAKERYWKSWLSVRQVVKAFEEMGEKTLAHSSPLF